MVIQLYAKRDTLAALFRSLSRCHGIENLDLIFWCDVPPAGDPESPSHRAAASVRDFVDALVPQYRPLFRSIEVHRNAQNHGTCATCRIGLDYAFAHHEFVVFAEDDVVFARDALTWFSAMRADPVFTDERCWAVAGESVLFDAGGRPIPDGWAGRMRDLAQAMRYDAFYIVEGFIPSTCFATTAGKWAEFGETRGRPLGDVDVCVRCRDENRVCILPFVARVVDTGERHELGWSVRHHGLDGVPVTKDTYLTSDDIEGEPLPFRLYPGSRDRLWRLTSMLDAQYHPGLLP